MFEKINLSQKLAKDRYKKIRPELEIKLGALQREIRLAKIPILIVFEGWDAAGKGTMINNLIAALDPRGFNVYPTNPPTDDERLHPFLWRFWTKIPARGRLAIFDRSWYGRVLVERIDKLIPKKDWQSAYDEINAFERQLTDNGMVIIKFFLHISKKEQKKRFNSLADNPATAWKVTETDWHNHKLYNKYAIAMEEMIERTDKPNSPWHIVEAHDNPFATVKIFSTVIDTLEDKLAAQANKQVSKPASKITKKQTEDAERSGALSRVDLTLDIAKEDYSKKIKQLQSEIWDLEHEIYVRRIPLIVMYEGWDAAGKGGNIRRFTQAMDPRGYEVVPIAAPNEIERQYHYLWRFWQKIPKAGHITIFDRTWYGRVLVERIEGFCTQEEWQRAYNEINETEYQLTDAGAVIVKFWLHLSKQEQLKRFRERQKTAYKQWKIGDEDWRNREKWNLYLVAVEEMFTKTSTTYAPWTIVEANSKYYGRIKALSTIIEAVKDRIK